MLWDWRFKRRQKKSKTKIKTQSNIVFKNVSLRPVIENLNCEIKSDSWVLLRGKNTLGKALFCDLCFSYVKPELGEIEAGVANSEVSFLGRGPTTYGHTLLEHIKCGTRNLSKIEIAKITDAVFSSDMNQYFSSDLPLNSQHGRKPLNEREYMELSEANILLQKRPAVIIDTCSEFYKKAIAKGFKHSDEFLDSKKIFFWLVDDESSYFNEQFPWQKIRNKNKVIFEFNDSQSVQQYN